ncbi:MAG: hypothetical protein MRZ79_07250 [Bacteroidia bacterium]|nr:hypothetical protein [Bacteroidia bacterium]
MENLLKKFFYTGVGLISITAERLQQTVDEMVGEGKVSEEEGKKIVGSFIDDVEKRRGEFENNMKETIDNFTANINAPEFLKNNFFTDLMDRLSAIEDKLGITREEAEKSNPVQEAVDQAAEKAKEVVEEVSDKAAEVIEEAKEEVKTTKKPRAKK